jgi:hypothetical protein
VTIQRGGFERAWFEGSLTGRPHRPGAFASSQVRGQMSVAAGSDRGGGVASRADGFPECHPAKPAKKSFGANKKTRLEVRWRQQRWVSR